MKTLREAAELLGCSSIRQIVKNSSLKDPISLRLILGSVSLDVVGWKVFPSLQNNGRPVISLKIRNKGMIDATKPFLVQIFEVIKSTTHEFDIIRLSNNQLPKVGETITITPDWRRKGDAQSRQQSLV